MRKGYKQQNVGDLALGSQGIGNDNQQAPHPQNLSGGERSRVGLIRALANQPQVMLLDEPFAALDPSTREQMGCWAFQQLADQNIPSVMVSHDVEDIPSSAKKLCLADHFHQKNYQKNQQENHKKNQE